MNPLQHLLLTGTITLCLSVLNPMTIIVSEEIQKGWIRNRDTENGIVRLLRDNRVSNPAEGVFTCEVEEDPGSPISLGIYYASESVLVLCK